MTIDRKKFFDGIRNGPFTGSLTAEQVQGIETTLNEWEKRKLTDLRELAYMLATKFWETERTMQPISERGGNAYFTRMYDIEGSRPELARRNGNIHAGDGIKFRGRGDVQLTWRSNYRRMGQLLKQPLEDQPDLAMVPEIATAIMFEGMLGGLFTGKKLEDYFNDTTTDWYNARRIINGVDRAQEIATVAKKFYEDLLAAQTDAVPQRGPEPEPAVPVEPSFWQSLVQMFKDAEWRP